MKEGTVVITVQAKDNPNAIDTMTIDIIRNGYVQDVDLGIDYLVLPLNKSDYKLTPNVTPKDAKNKTVEWFSDNKSVLGIDRYTGVMYPKKEGVATITAGAADLGGAIDTCQVAVVKNLKEVASYETKEDLGTNKKHKDLFADPVDVYTGAHLLENTLMQFFDGQKLALKLSYDSSKLASGIFGKGWYHNFEKFVVPPVDLNTAIEICVNTSPSVYSIFKNDYSAEYRCQTPNKKSWFLHVGGEDYTYNLCCGYERNEYYDANGRLFKIIGRDGFETNLTYIENLITITDGITGKKIYLSKDSSGKVTRVYDDYNREAIITYENDLITNIKDVNGKYLSFTYNEKGQVLTGTDGKGTCYFTNTYDPSDRVQRQKDAIEESEESKFEYDDENNTRTTTDRNDDTSVRVYNKKGLLESYTDADGNTECYFYDENNNTIEEKDAKGFSVKKEYNQFNKPIKITDKLGNVTNLEYDGIGNLTKIIYPAVDGVSAEETFTYGNVGGAYKLLSHTDVRGTVTQYTYDSETKLPLTKKVGDRNPIRYIYQNGIYGGYYDAKGALIRLGHNDIGLLSYDVEKGIEYEYDNRGNLLKTTDALGNVVKNEYDCNNQKTSVTDANGNLTQYEYNGNMKNTCIISPNDRKIINQYDGEDRLVKVTDQMGNTTVTTYDCEGRVTSKRFSDGGEVMYSYDEVGNLIEETNQNQAKIIKTYDANGNVLTITDDDNNVISFVYDERNRLKQKTDAAGGITTYTYSAGGDLLSETDALGNTKTYTYDAYGNKLTETDARGNTTTYTYDANNNLTTVTDALNNTTTYGYDYLNRLVTVTDAKNHTVTYGYDMAGRRNTITDAKGNVFTTYYDGNGNVIKTTDAKGKTITETVYNNLNLPESVSDGFGNTTYYLYNALGKVQMQTNPLGHTRQFTYNSRGMNTIVKDYLGNDSSVEYDSLGNVTDMTGPMSAVTSYTYDKYGKILSQSTPSGSSIQYTYNAQQLKESVTNGRGQVHQYTYDALGRITAITKPEGVTTYTYDANGNILTVTDNKGTITREYDELNRVIHYRDVNGKDVRYEYDAVGNLSAIQYYHAVKVLYTYDENNNLSTVTDWNGRVTSYSYDVNNNLIGVVNANGTTTTKVYDDMQRLISSVDKKADDTIICGFEYTYDALGQISTEKNLANNKIICYTYDSLSRLIKREVKNSDDEVLSAQNFAYDAAGNIISAPTGTFSYDTQNKLTTYNGESVEYDLDGNMLTMPVQDIPEEYAHVFYDSSNRLLNAMGSTYTYDAENNRIRVVNPYFEQDFVYNTNCKLSQVLASFEFGNPIFYIYGLGLIGEEQNGQFYTYHYDYRGSTLAMTDQSGNIVVTAEYDVYGKMLSADGDRRVLFGYNGRDGVQSDTNGLLYMRARYYCPDRRRFVNADIIQGDINDSTSLNRYAYVNGNPVSLVDPFGLSAERGAVIYNGIKYYIHVPDQMSTGESFKAKWKTTSEITVSDFSIEWAKLIAGTSFDDVNGLANGTNSVINNKQKRTAGIAGVFEGLLTSAAASTNSIYINFVFQEYDGKHRVIIKVGSNKVTQLYNTYADGIAHSAYFSNSGSPLAQALISNYAGELYEKATGKTVEKCDTYDIRVTVDKAHQGDKYSSYLWIDEYGTIMETPILYKNDKVEIGRRSGLFGFGFTHLLDISLGGSAPVSEEYQKLFEQAF